MFSENDSILFYCKREKILAKWDEFEVGNIVELEFRVVNHYTFPITLYSFSIIIMHRYNFLLQIKETRSLIKN